MKNLMLSFALITTLVMTSCKQSSKIETQTLDEEPQAEKAPKVKEVSANATEIYAPQSVNDTLAERIKTYIKDEYLKKNDLELIPVEQRKFQFYQIDLDNDGKPEIFVNFLTSFFCGTGGCNILLLNNNLKKITNFTVMRTPLYVENKSKNGWKIILVRSEGELKELSFNKGTYPSNPSVVEKAPYDAPSGSAVIMFDETYSKAKTYAF
jgi:hypothetical protein